MKRDLNTVLDEIEDYLERHQDADFVGDRYQPNEALQLLMDLKDSRA